jgi:hypothetical protein
VLSNVLNAKSNRSLQPDTLARAAE